MIRASKANTAFKALLVAAAALGLAACGQKEKTEYKTDVTDESGGDLIVETPNPDAVDEGIRNNFV